jgi:hypothetical protein
MATVANQYITVQGPIKMEIVHLTAVTTADTFVSKLQRPLFAIAVNSLSAGAATSTTTATISTRTITVASSDFAGAGVCDVLVFGY